MHISRTVTLRCFSYLHGCPFSNSDSHARLGCDLLLLSLRCYRLMVKWPCPSCKNATALKRLHLNFEQPLEHSGNCHKCQQEFELHASAFRAVIATIPYIAVLYLVFTFVPQTHVVLLGTRIDILHGLLAVGAGGIWARPMLRFCLRASPKDLSARSS